MPKQHEGKIPVTLIPGDGIGPEIVESVLEVLEAVDAPFSWEEQVAGMAAMEKYKDPLPQVTLDSIRRTKLALKGPLTTPVGGGYRSANVVLRQTFDLYANVRPARTWIPGGRYEGVDLVMVRENTEGYYVGFEHYFPIEGDPHAVAIGAGINTRAGCRRIAEFAFDYALRNGRRKITIVHKANILKALTGVFLETVREVGKLYEDKLTIEDRIVDACAMQLVMDPSKFDVLLTTNMFGDILSDLMAGLVGGLGMAPGANIGKDAAIFEAVHGSAPDIAGKGVANPIALLLAACLMLEYVDEHATARRLRSTIKQVLAEDKVRTRDLGGSATTGDMTRAIVERLKS
ncbi:MAG: NAD-dependent isocitrate dehydrogenase [Gammaproteobacteria bacterium]|nr:NAD-dependent isocitrate dehydrogenase [Gammaproteobacteria bacterium]